MSGVIMPQVQLPDWSRVNELFDNAKNQRELLGNQVLQQQAQKLGLENAYTEAVQPAQINGLIQALGEYNTSQAAPSPTPAPGDTSGGAQSAGLTVTPVQPGQSLFVGDMPVSRDTAQQQRVGQIAEAEGVNPQWAMRVAHRETGRETNSMAARGGSGEIGTMQLMPATAADLKVDPLDSEQNARGGVTYLKQMKEQFGDPVIATAAYNAGPKRVQDWLAGRGNLPASTVQYVGDVFGGDGTQLLHNALGGGHGHPIGGVQVGQSGGLQSVVMDDAARAEVKRLIGMRQIALMQPGGAGMRALGQIQAQLDNIAGPGGVVDSKTGNVYRVPGSFATRYAASQATEAGKVGPQTQLAVNKAGIAVQQDAAQEQGRIAPRTQLAQNEASIQQARSAAEEAEKTRQLALRPTTVGQGATLTIPATVGVGVPAPAGAAPATTQSVAAQPGQTPGVFQAPKEIPPGIQQMDNEDVGAIQTAASIKTDLNALQQQIESGKLELGPVQNTISRARNTMGRSDENSRNFASFEAELMRLQNDSLRLNKGVQTEGDAQRAWKELVTNINDPGVVKQRLAEIQKLNDRAVQLRGQELNRRRVQNGGSPIDLNTLTRQEPTVGQGSKPAGAVPLPTLVQDGKSVPDSSKLEDGRSYALPNGLVARFDAKRQTFVSQ